MLRKIEIGVSRESVSIPEVGIGISVSEFIQSRAVHDQLVECIARGRVVIHLSPDVCESRVVSVFGISWRIWSPNPLVYFPVLDALDRLGIRVSGVTLSGRRPYRGVVLGAWLGVGLVVLGTVMGLGQVAKKKRVQQRLSDHQLFEIGQREDNKRYIRQINDAVWGRCSQVIQGVRAVQGVIVSAEVQPVRAQVQFVVSDDQSDAAVAWAKTLAPEVSVDSVADGWVLVHAQ